MRYSLVIACLFCAWFVCRADDPFEEHKDAKALVFVFVSNECPIANRYAPEIERLHRRFASNQVQFFVVHADPAASVEAIETHTREYGYTCRVLRDADQKLARRAGAKVTPEAAVFLPNGRRIYRGRIDNRYMELGKARREPTTRDLQAVLEAIVQGKPVRAAQTRAIGCHIPGLK